NVTVDGTTKPETSEYFVVEAKKGQRLSVEVEGVRANSVRGVLGIDPYVGIMNMKRFLLASADDTPLLKQDCFVSCVIPEDGKYIVEVRDSAYQGNARFRAHIGTFPRPTVAYPAGGQAGTEVEFTMIGDPKGDYRFKTKLPAQPKDRFGYQLPGHRDPRGVFVEILKTPDSGQFSYFTINPGFARGGHYHNTMNEKILVVKGTAVIRLRHLLTGELVEIPTSGDRPEVVDTIPGWAHEVNNIGSDELVVMLWANEIYDPAHPDTIPSKV
ncbi:MAG: hypothetical protein EBV06_17790, partial [Planctomycetia bacterium]|nr:hypothetical protein [Planctomycetia bacterium]